MTDSLASKERWTLEVEGREYAAHLKSSGVHGYTIVQDLVARIEHLHEEVRRFEAWKSECDEGARADCNRAAELQRRIDFAVGELAEPYISDSAAEWVRTSVLAVLMGKITPTGEVVRAEPPEDRHAYATKDDLFNAGATHAAYRIHYARALREIADFGKANSGCGFSCAKKAEKALEFIYRASETKTADVCDDCGARGGQHYSLCSKRALADMAPLCNHGRPADHCDACEEDIERSHSDSLIEKLESVTAPETSVRHPGIKFCASCGKPAPSTVDPDVRLVVYQCEHCGYSNDVTDAVLSESETPRHG